MTVLEFSIEFFVKVHDFSPCRAFNGGSTIFAVFHPHFGGFGIAVLRLVVIRYPLIAQRRGLKFLMWAFVLMGNVLNITCYILWINFNMEESEAILAECFEPSPTRNGYSIGRSCTLFLITFAMFGEMICYLWIGYQIHQQDKSMVHQLSREVITKRHKRNVIDLSGMFYILADSISFQLNSSSNFLLAFTRSHLPLHHRDVLFGNLLGGGDTLSNT